MAQADQNTTPPAGVEGADKTTLTPELTTPPENVTDSIVDSLLKGADDFKIEIQSESEPSEEPAATTPDAATDEEVDQDPVAPAKPGVTEVPPAVADDADPVVAVPHPYDEDDDPILDAPPDRTKMHASFDKLRGKLRDARQRGEFGQMIVDTAVQANLDPQALASVVGLTARAKRGDRAAASELLQVLQDQGVVFAQPAAPAAAKAPVATAEAIESVYADLFASEVDNLSMTESVARRKAKEIATRQAALLQPQNVQTPQPSQSAPPAPAQAAAPVQDPQITRAQNQLEQLNAQYTTAYAAKGKDFAPIRDAALQRIAARVKASGPVHPAAWHYEFNEEVRKIQAEAVQKTKQAAPKPRTGSAPLRAGSHGSAPAPKNNAFDDLANALITGGLDKLN